MGASSGVAQPTTDTEATTTIPLVRAEAQCTKGNLRGGGCGLLEDEPVNCRWITGGRVHRGGGARARARASPQPDRWPVATVRLR
jgi:hypothetical protein